MARRGWKKDRNWQEKVKAEVESLNKRLEAGVQAILGSDEWKAYLKAQAVFHTYSFRNTILILSQMPSATRVAGFGTWKKLGRYVKKGQSGLRILRPQFVKKMDAVTGEEEQVLVGFRPASVFDISQTEGAELPEPPLLRLDGNSSEAETLYNLLRQEIIPIPVHEGDTGNSDCYGWFDRGDESIMIKAEASMDQKAKTLIHEYTHFLLHRKGKPEVERDEMEAVAEGTAYVVAARYGLDTSAYSFGYVAGWAGNLELIQAVGEQIQQTAKLIIGQIDYALGLVDEEDFEEAVVEAV